MFFIYIYFTLKHGLCLVLHTFCFLFLVINFSMKFMHANRISPDGRKEPALFDGLLGHPYGIDKHYALVICNHVTQPRRGRVIEPCFRFFIVSAVPRKYQGFVSYR